MRIRTTISRLIATVAISGLGLVGEASAQEFSYNGDTGPGFWSQLSPDWEACSGAATNARQSPINISRVRIDKDLENLDTAIFPTTIDIFNNGHTIEQHYAATGSSITFEGTYYELQQFHFHTLSEHSIDDAQGVMELHAVFQEPGGGDHLVIGMLFHVGGRQNPFPQTLIDAGLPGKNGDTIETEEQIDLADAFTNTKSYYTYRVAHDATVQRDRHLGYPFTIGANESASNSRRSDRFLVTTSGPLNPRMVESSAPARRGLVARTTDARSVRRTATSAMACCRQPSFVYFLVRHFAANVLDLVE